MKSSILGFLFLFVVGLAFTSCAPTMSLDTQSNSNVPLSKSAPHYIVPPLPGDSVQNQNLYSLVVSAFKQNHIALTQTEKSATYLVTWGTQTKSTQVKSLQAMPSSYPYGYGGNLNRNGYPSAYGYGNPALGMPATGPEYATVMRSVNMQHFTINVWKQGATGGPEGDAVWSGNASTGMHSAKDPAAIINDIVARYGTNFNEKTEIGTGAAKN